MKRHHPSPDDHPARSSPAPPQPQPQPQQQPQSQPQPQPQPQSQQQPIASTPAPTLLTSTALVSPPTNKSPPPPTSPPVEPSSPTSSPSSPDLSSSATDEVALLVRWGTITYAVELELSETVADLKDRLFELTEVRPHRQKVLGLPAAAGRPPRDDIVLSTLPLKFEQRLIMVGSREQDYSAVHDAISAAAAAAAGTVVNDLDFDYSVDDPAAGARVVKDLSAYRRRLERRIETTEIRIMNPLREGKKLLVLDLDYTLFDCRSSAATIADLGRPGLHSFLASAYRYYDIVIWSQTSWRWLEAKLTGLNMVFSDQFKIAFVLDRTSMFSVTSRRGRDERTHEVKALEIIWRKFPQRWNAQNTIHIDDISRNFALNPQSGLKIHPFRNAPVSRATDRELPKLDRYLTLIATLEPDFTKLKHKHWKHYCTRHIPEWDSLFGNGAGSSNR